MMKRKKVLLSLVMFFGLLACCPPRADYWSFESFTLHLIDKTGLKTKESIVAGDSLWIVLRFDATLVYEDALLLHGFTNPVYGFSCDEDGTLGLIDKIVACTISSDHTFQGYPAGSSLNELFFTNGYNLDEWVLQSGDWPLPLVGETDIMLKEHPGNQEFHVFKMIFELESGKKVESITNAVRWQ